MRIQPPTRVAAWLTRLAPGLLALSVSTRLAWTYLVPNGANFVDLHVYLGGAAAAWTNRALYSYVYADQTPDFPLPLHLPAVPCPAVLPAEQSAVRRGGLCWQLGTIAALYGVIRISQRLVWAGPQPPAGRRQAMLWTAVAIWLEPLRSTFDYGQVNVILVLAVLAAAA